MLEVGDPGHGDANQKSIGHVSTQCHHWHAARREMHARGTTTQRDVEALADDDWNGEHGNQGPPGFHQQAGIHMFQSEQQHRRATTLRRQRSHHQTSDTIPQIIGDCAEAQSRIIVLDHFRRTRGRRDTADDLDLAEWHPD